MERLSVWPAAAWVRVSAPAKPVGRLEGKIGLWHRDRLPVVYVRQPTAAQVADPSESTQLQYGLAGRDQPWAGRDLPWAGRRRGC